jgi:hypothetical protein
MRDNATEYIDLPSSKAELLECIRREWEALERAVGQVSTQDMQVPDSGGWSVKDNLAHLAEWERYLRLHHMQGIPAHEVMDLEASAYESIDQDQVNAILLGRSQHCSAEEVLASLSASHSHLLRDLDQMPFARMLEQAHAEDELARPLLAWIAGNTYQHYREHRTSIEKLASRS